jgi:hypothetical protein
MTSAVDAVSLTNLSASTAAFKLNGGYYLVSAIAASWSGGNIELQALGPDGSTWLSLPTALKLSANGEIGGYLSPGQYRFTVTTTTGISCSVAGVRKRRA